MPDIYIYIRCYLAKYIKIEMYRTIILPVVFYGCETWSLTLREERRLRMSENRMLRRIFGRKRENGENYITWKLRELFSCIIVRLIKSRRMR